ncbi:hypothetical protein ABIB40_001153 [Pedobacter sp. UYP30]|uniref:hypothetical protein n=1 Tax=Pedobacter sp. UYP30 TaxID=1756400 RepID=UPI003392AAE7
MKNNLLLPNKFKMIGWVVFLFSFCLFIMVPWFNNGEQLKLIDELDKSSGLRVDVWVTVSLALITVGLFSIAFAREKQEDEYISLLRLKSWQWSVAISYGILFIANLLFYEMAFAGFMIYNMFTVLLAFIVVFYWSLFKLRREGADDEK